MEKHLIDTEEYEEEIRNALVCEDGSELRAAISAALEKLKYNIQFAAGSEDALEKIKFNEYDLVILSEQFDGSTSENNTLGNFLTSMPMSVRRRIFLVLKGKDFKTADNMTAFSRSSNLVVNEKDIPNLKNILRKVVEDNDLLYKVFKETLARLGKQ